jgi:hypothetical protein
MTRADQRHSTPRRSAPKIQTKKRAGKTGLFETPPTTHLVALGDDKPAASVARAEQIVELLTVCYVRKGWKIDEAAAERALAYCRAYAKDGSDPDDERAAAMDFFRSHGQSLDWVFAGDIRGMICGLAKHSERAVDVAGPIEAPAQERP